MYVYNTLVLNSLLPFLLRHFNTNTLVTSRSLLFKNKNLKTLLLLTGTNGYRQCSKDVITEKSLYWLTFMPTFYIKHCIIVEYSFIWYEFVYNMRGCWKCVILCKIMLNSLISFEGLRIFKETWEGMSLFENRKKDL